MLPIHLRSRVTPKQIAAMMEPDTAKLYIDPYISELALHLKQTARERGGHLYMLTTTYLDPLKFPLTKTRATLQFGKFHLFLLNYLAGHGHINRPWFRKIEPIIYAYLEPPGSKRKANPTYTPIKTSTYHHHCIVLAVSEHKSLFDDLTNETIAKQFTHDARKYCTLRTLHVQPILDTMGDLLKVIDYCSDYARRYPEDEHLLLV
jgi:hypothetical protein